jgi:hypothetical protein
MHVLKSHKETQLKIARKIIKGGWWEGDKRE